MTGSSSHRRGDELLARIIAGDDTGLSNELLKECFNGYPVQKLTTLLRSDDEKLVKSGVWIASELAGAARPLLNALRPLLVHPAVGVRAYVIDAVLLAATDEDGEIVADAVMRIEDDDQRVRWPALRLLARADREQLEAAVPYLADQGVATATRRLLDEEGQPTSSVDVLQRLADGDRTTRLFALATAARTREDDVSTLLAATEAKDDEIRSFALRVARGLRMIPRES